jgi:uncharacterized coiled-coil protein SlyX
VQKELEEVHRDQVELEAELDDKQSWVDNMQDELAKLTAKLKETAPPTVAGSAAELGRLRKAVFAAQKAGKLAFSLPFVRAICVEADAPAEAIRVAAMLPLPSTDVPTPRKVARTRTHERRVVGAWFISLGATSERATFLRETLDVLSNHNIENQEMAAGVGIGQSVTTNKRRRRCLKKAYSVRFR